MEKSLFLSCYNFKGLKLSSDRIDFIDEPSENQTIFVAVGFIEFYFTVLFNSRSNRHQKFSFSKGFDFLFDVYL
nr:MAG TPA: hypothetical protein [Caudoviricetes sp.]